MLIFKLFHIHFYIWGDFFIFEIVKIFQSSAGIEDDI